MRQPITMRFDLNVVNAAKVKATQDNRTLTNYIETLVRRDLEMMGEEQLLEIIAPPGIRDSVAVRISGETEEEFNLREEIFHAVINAGGL